MKILFVLNSLLEAVFGALAIVAPQVVWRGGDALALANGRAFGCGALAAAILGILALRNAEDRRAARVAIGALFAFHLALAAAQGLAAYDHVAAPPVAVIHGAFAVAFGVVLFRQRAVATARP